MSFLKKDNQKTRKAARKHVIIVTDREHAHILALLRLAAAKGSFSNGFDDIATNGGLWPLMTEDELWAFGDDWNLRPTLDL